MLSQRALCAHMPQPSAPKFKGQVAATRRQFACPWDTDGFVSTCNSTNFFIVRGGAVWTSSGRCGTLLSVEAACGTLCVSVLCGILYATYSVLQ